MNYIIVDLEATCWNPRNGMVNEIIEIGAVKLNDSLEVIDEFCEFIKPHLNPVLSEFCQELTTITQVEVNSGMTFPEALVKFQEWIGEDYCLCSWGMYDKKQFNNDCLLHALDTEWLEKHISIKHQYADFTGSKRMGMKRALKKEGFPLDGTHHRGIDDAKNIAKIFIKQFENFTFPNG